MAAIGIVSLLAGAAMQTEPLRSFCHIGSTPQARVSGDCMQDRMALMNARAQSMESGRAALQGRRLESGNPIPNAAGDARDRDRQGHNEEPIGLLPADAHATKPSKS
jgi:hypothetical protein